MNISYKLATTAIAALLSVSGIASAADLVTGPQESDGYITKSTCGSITPVLAAGAATDSWAYYPGATHTGFTLVTAGTTSSGAAGSANSQVCVATTAVPSTGLNGAAITFNCYDDKVTGPASSAQAQLQSTFKVGASHSSKVFQVTTTATLVVNGAPLCSFTSDGTWTAE